MKKKAFLANELLNHLITAVMVIDKSLNISFANVAAEQLFGLSLLKFKTLPLNELSKNLDIDYALLQNIISKHQGFTFNTVKLVTLDGHIHTVDISLSPIENQPNISLMELRQIDQQQLIYQQMVQDFQQQTAQYLIKNLAHEIKNPLGGLRGAAQLLAKELNQSQLTEFTDLIIEQADRLSTLVDKLLGPNKVSPQTTVNIHEVTEKVLQLIQLTLPTKIKIIKDYDPSIPLIKIDADQIQQALLNIIQNAIQAMSLCGDSICIRSRSRHQVTINSIRHKLVLALSIIDNGQGIPPHLMDTLFYPMVTSKQNGTGLGLSIAQNIIRFHGGRIDCNSHQTYTEFTILLPIK